MGYYSEVAIAFTKKGYDYLQTKLDTSNFDPEERKLINAFFHLGIKVVDENSGSVLLHWRFAKWYGSLPVELIENTLGELDDTDYLEIVIGENVEDCLENGSFWSNPFELELIRSVSYKTNL